MGAARAVPAAAGKRAPVGRIGPNAITQCIAALDAQHGQAVTARVFALAGLTGHLTEPPVAMVDEQAVLRLHQALRQVLGVAAARALGREAGRRTAAYLMAHRIPGPMHWLLPRLPAAWAGRLLLRAIAGHAWTFCGSGGFRVLAPPAGGRGWRFMLQGAATCRGTRADVPLCDYFAATFEGLFDRLVQPGCRCEETACMAQGAPACEFTLRLA